MAAGGGFRLESCADGYDVLGFAFDAIGIRHNESAFVLRRGFKIEDAPRETVRHDVVERVFVDTLVADAQERQTFLPGLFALLPIVDSDRCIPIVVTVD